MTDIDPKLPQDNDRVNRDAATRTEDGLVESDTMGGTTIRRLAKRQA